MHDTAEPVDIQAGTPRERADTPAERVKKAKASRQKATLPRPKALRVSIEQYEKWNRGFTGEQKGRAIHHLYREWPAINRKLVGEQKEKLIQQWEGIPPFEPDEEIPDIKTFVLKNQEYGGSGKYKLMCTEIGIPGCISMTSFVLEDPDYPPRVDPAVLVVGHPLNKGYIEGLRASGIAIPGDDPEKYRAGQEQKEEMNIAGTLVSTLADQNKELREEIKEQRETFQEQIEELRADEPEDETGPLGKSVLEAGLRMVEKQVDRVTQASAVSYNPIEVAKAVMEMSKEMKGDSAGMMNVMQGMMTQQAAFLQTMLESQRKETEYWRRLAIEKPENGATPKSMLDQVEELAKFKALSRELFGGAREPRESREPETPRKNWMETLLENPKFPELANGALGMAAQLISLLRAPQPGAPPAPAPDALKAALNGQPQPAQVAQPAPDPVAQARAATLAFMQRIEKPFIAAFYDLEQMGLNGYTFARHMHCEFVPDGQVTPAGRQEYETIRDRWGKQLPGDPQLSTDLEHGARQPGQVH